MGNEAAELTFRDFAGAIMGNDDAKAASVLEVLLAIDGDAATAATSHFRAGINGDPQFMMKAMGLRTAVTSGSEDEINAVLTDCFALASDTMAQASTALRARYQS